MNQLHEQLAINIRAIIDNSNMTPHEIAATIDKGVRSVWKYCSGKQQPGLKSIIALCNCLDVSPNDILKDCYSLDDIFSIEPILEHLTVHSYSRIKLLVDYFYSQAVRFAGSNLGERIKLLMDEQGIHAEDVIDKTPYAESTFHSMIHGMKFSLPRVENVIALCAALETTPHYLLQDYLNIQEPTLREQLMCLTPLQIKLIRNMLD